MDNIFEILVPLIIAGIYFFGNMLSNKSDGDVAPPAGASDEEADAIERQRRIQEEIRRKIMERRRSAEGGAAPQSESRPPEPSESARERESPYSHTAESARESVPRMSRHIEASAPAPRGPDFASEQPDPYQTKIESKLKQIEATKRQAAKLQKQAAQSGASGRSRAARGADTSGRSRAARRPIRATLRDPAAARAAFIYSEVLGPPVSQRKAQTVPGLS